MRTVYPPWWATLGTLALGGLFVAAGFWQLGRADEKRALFARFDAGMAGPAAAAPPPRANVDALRYQPVVASGRYDAAHQVLLDARVRDGQAGYEVLTPLLREGEPAVLVNRGWVPAGGDRSRLPDVAVATEPRKVTGLLDALPRAAFVAGAAAAPGSGWPRLLLYPRSSDVAAAVGYPVTDYQVLLAPGDADGYLRQWRPAVMPPERHVGYAVQWFALAAALVVIYVVLNSRRAPTNHP